MTLVSDASTRACHGAPRVRSALLRTAAALLFALASFPTLAENDAPKKAIVDDDPCRGVKKSEVRVQGKRALMFLCSDGKVDARYPVNLGQGGFGKEKRGDQKTPVGRYPLSKPRPSYSGFTWFVRVGYPTAAERAAGKTGGDIGIHGPPEGWPQEIIDEAFETPWTDGCIMVRTTAEIDAVRAWVLEKKPAFIEISDG